MGGQFHKEILKFGYFKKWKKSKNNVGVAEEIGWENNTVLRKIGAAQKN